MANIRIKLDRRNMRADESFPVILALTHRRDSIRIGLRLYARDAEWDEVQGLFLGTGVEVRANNARLRHMLSLTDTLLLNLSISGELDKMTSREVKSRIEKELNITQARGAGATVADYLERAKAGKAPRTQLLFQYTQKRVLRYAENRRVQDVDAKWVEALRDALSEDMSANTIRQDLTRLTRAFTLAMDDGIITRNPCKGIKKPVARVRKKALTLEQLRQLRDLDIKNPGKRRARDIFMLQFYLIGINLVDLYSAVSLSAGRLEYVRHKTKMLYSVKVEPEAMRLIESMPGVGKLVNIPYKDAISAVSSVTGSLQRLGVHADLSTNWARHTWATIAAELEIPIETISHALGHQIGSPVTAIYVAFNQKKVDEANRKVIDYLNADLRGKK